MRLIVQWLALASAGLTALSGLSVGCASSPSSDASGGDTEEALSVANGSAVRVNATCRTVMMDVLQPTHASGAAQRAQPFDDDACTEYARPPAAGMGIWDGGTTFTRPASLVIRDLPNGDVSVELAMDGSTAPPPRDAAGHLTMGRGDVTSWLNPTLASTPLRLTIAPEATARRRDYAKRALQTYPDGPGPAGFWLETLSTGQRSGAALHLSHAATYYTKAWPGNPCPTHGERMVCELDVVLPP